MVAKKKNAFICFVNDWRKSNKHISWEESITKAGIEWAKMSTEERLPYKTEALKYDANKGSIKPQQKPHHQKLPKTLSETPIQLKENKERISKRHTDRMVQNSIEQTEFDTQTYYFMMVNYFAKTANSEMCQPAELAIAKFSLQTGIEDVYHKLINPGPSLYGSKYDTQCHAKNTHQLPIPPNALGDDNLEQLYKDILNFMQISETEDDHDVSHPIFTLKEDIPIVSSSLKYLNEDVHDFKIYSIEYLFFVLKNATCQISGLPPPRNIYETNLIFERDPYEYEVNISCDYHEQRELSKHCAKSYVTRWGFLFAHYMCNDLAITMLPNCHKPDNSQPYMPIINTMLKTEEKPKILKEENMEENPNVTQITEYPDDNFEDLWDDLNKLTDILEKEFSEKHNVMIKTEVNDDDNVAPPPPPPISLGEVNDEFAQFTRRMKLSNPNLVNEEKVNMDTPTSTLTASPGEKQSDATKTKTTLKEIEGKSPRKSQEISQHDRTKSPTSNSPSSRRSRSRRKLSRSQSRKRNTYQRKKKSSRHYRKSRSSRRRSISRNHERRENVSRIDRGITRSGSREYKSYRKRSFSRERSLSLTRHRRSRSRSNLRINRSIRRSRSRSRYRCSSNRRRSRSRSLHRHRSFRERSSSTSSLSPTIRYSSFTDRTGSPKAYRNPSPDIENDQSIVPFSFTNAAPPYLPPTQLPIYPIASNRIPPNAIQHYVPQQMPHGTMQYTQTTYSSQYYRAGPIPASSYMQPLLPLSNEFTGPVIPTAPRFLNENDLRHRISGHHAFYQPHPYANYQNPYPSYMGAQHQYASYSLQ